MSLPAIALIAVALGMDAFSMAVGLGITGVRRRNILVISVVVCLFHVFMPLAGWTLGAIAGSVVGRFARIFGAAVLIFIGVRGLLEALKNRHSCVERAASTRQVRGGEFGLIPLVVLAGSVSLDALSVGFGLGTMGVNLWLTVVFFGTAAGLMTAAGFLFGKRLGRWLGSKADFVGAIILLLIGIKMLF